MEDIFGWDGDGHPIVQQALLRHIWVDNLEHSQSVGMGILNNFHIQLLLLNNYRVLEYVETKESKEESKIWEGVNQPYYVHRLLRSVNDILYTVNSR